MLIEPMRAQPYQISGTPQSIKKRGILADVSAEIFGFLEFSAGFLRNPNLCQRYFLYFLLNKSE